MSGFVSSAVSGKKIVPKAAAGRRRPAAPVNKAPSTPATQPAVSTVLSINASDGLDTPTLPTPAATQDTTTTLPTSVAAQKDADASEEELPVAQQEPASASTQIQAHSQPEEGNSALTEGQTSPTDATEIDATEISTGRKRSRGAEGGKHDTSSSKRPRRNVSSIVQNEREPDTESPVLLRDTPEIPVGAEEPRASGPPDVIETAIMSLQTVSQDSPQNEERVSSVEQVQDAMNAGVRKERNKPKSGVQKPVVAKKRKAARNQAIQNSTEVASDSTLTPRRRERRRREVTQADGVADDAETGNPELHEINPAQLSMLELTHNASHGKVSEREKKMAEIDWDEVSRKRREAAAKLLQGETSKEDEPTSDVSKTVEAQVEDNTTLPQSETSPPAGTSEDAGNAASTQPIPSGGLRFRMVNGQIVEDEETLAIDRQADAEANALNNEFVEEENDLTIRVNRSTWVNNRRRDVADRVPQWKSKSDPWSEEETDRFYDALRMFGTDFFIISKMFPPKTRRQIKTKFTREEKLDSTRIDNALLGKETKRMDIEHYARESGRDVTAYTKYDSYEHAKEVIRESLKEKEELYEQAMREEVENARQETIQREQRKAATENRKHSRKGRKGRMGAGTLGGGQE